MIDMVKYPNTPNASKLDRKSPRGMSITPNSFKSF